MDGFPESLRDVVNDHWHQFPPQHPLIVDILAIVFLLLTFICCIANALIIYTFLTTRTLRNPVSTSWPSSSAQ